MHIKSIYKVRQLAGENLVVGQGRPNADMTKVISLNDTAVLLWNELAGRDFTLDEAAAVLVKHFGIPEEQALTDATRWADSLRQCGVIEA